MKTSVEGKCPFCGGKWKMGYSTEDEPLGVHSEPPCKDWLDMDLPEFMKAVRIKLKAQTVN